MAYATCIEFTQWCMLNSCVPVWPLLKQFSRYSPFRVGKSHFLALFTGQIRTGAKLTEGVSQAANFSLKQLTILDVRHVTEFGVNS